MHASILYLEFIPFVKAFLLMNVYCPLFNRLTFKTIFPKTKSCMIMSFHGLFSWAVRGVTLFGCILKNFLCMNRVCSSEIIQSIKIPICKLYDSCFTGLVEWSSVHRTETEEAHGKGVWWLYRRVHGSREKEVRKLFLLLEETIQFLFKTIFLTYLYFSFNDQVWTRHIDPIWRLWKSQCLQILGKIQRQVLHV